MSVVRGGILFFIWHNLLDRARTHVTFNLDVAIIILHLYFCTAIRHSSNNINILHLFLLNFAAFDDARFRFFVDINKSEGFSKFNIFYTRSTKILFVHLRKEFFCTFALLMTRHAKIASFFAYNVRKISVNLFVFRKITN